LPIWCQVRSVFFVALIPCALSHFLWSACALVSAAVLGRLTGLRFGVDILITRDICLIPADPSVGFTEIWSGCRAGPVLPLTPIIATIDRLLRGAIGVPRWFYPSHRIDTGHVYGSSPSRNPLELRSLRCGRVPPRVGEDWLVVAACLRRKLCRRPRAYLRSSGSAGATPGAPPVMLISRLIFRNCGH